MVSSPHALRARFRLRVGGKVLLAVGVLVPAVLATAGVGALGLQRMDARTDALYSHGLAVSEQSADVVAAVLTVHETALYQVAVEDPHLNDQLTSELDLVLLPRAQAAITALRADYAGEPEHLAAVDRLVEGLQAYLGLRESGVYDDGAGETAAARAALAQRTDALLEPVVDAAEQLRTDGAAQSARVKARSEATYRSTRQVLALCVLVVLLLGLAAVRVLVRDVVPRLREYSAFAADIAAGRPTTALRPGGHDELSELGAALNDMVEHRERSGQAEQVERARVAEADAAQAEFVDTLQVTRSEDEAQELLQHHLQRSLPDSAVAVLRQNNSANRLEAATALSQDDPLTDRLVGAEPRACVAVRLGRTHHEGTDRPPLLGCALCAHTARPSTCEPLLVGGEVIGAVLVAHGSPDVEAADLRIRSTVGQAAPVLANLRTLALAEFRANNDSLTGLPNKRATEDTLKRMVAQACRSLAPLTAVMLDLDHFKQINDRHGHALGDEVLAAVGTAISSSLRTSDFAGRFGGEEFLLLLPDTPLEGAWQVAEKVRGAVAALTVPGLERGVTASLGIAALLEHAGNAAGLLSEADKAQYAAKAAGRNRTVVATRPVGGPEARQPEPAAPRSATT